MQKPTIEKIEMEDLGYVVNVVTDTNGVRHHYCGYGVARDLHQSELSKWQAEQESQVLFESETIKVIKFADSTQLELQINKGTGDGILKRASLFNYSIPILFAKIEDCEMWYAVCNISPDLIKAVQSVNVNMAEALRLMRDVE